MEASRRTGWQATSHPVVTHLSPLPVLPALGTELVGAGPVRDWLGGVDARVGGLVRLTVMLLSGVRVGAVVGAVVGPCEWEAEAESWSSESWPINSCPYFSTQYAE